MLRVFRDNLKYLKWVLWLVVLVFVGFAFLDFGSIDLAARGGGGINAAAVVGDDKIAYREFEQAYRRLEGQYREAYGEQFTRELADQLGLPMQVLNQLVNERIVLREAERMGLGVTDSELRESILGLPVFQEGGKFIGQEAYSALLERNGLRAEDFETSQREAILAQKVQNALAQTVYVGADEIEADYRRQAETATVRLVRLPATKFASEVTVDDAALAAFFEAHKEDFRLPERRVVDYLVVDPAGLRDTVEVDDAAVRAYYDGNQDDYTGEEQVKARHILLRTNAERTLDAARTELEAIKERLEGGADFAELAAELSDDPGSKVKGGDLGFFARGAMVKPFEDAAFGAELGDLVGPVESSFGVHLIQVQARRPGGVQPFEEVEAAIRARLVGEAAAEAARTKAGELAARLAKDVPTTEGLSVLAGSEAGTSAVVTEPFGRDDNVPGIGRATEFTTQAFELAVGAVAEPVQIARGWAMLVLREIQEPRLAEFGEVRSEVAAEFRSQRQLELAEARAAEAQAGLAQGQTLDDVAGELGVTVEAPAPFGADGAVGSLGQASDIARLALSMDAGAMSDPVVREGEVVFFEVTERTRFDSEKFAGEKDAVRERLESQRLNEVLGSIIARRRDELGVTFDPQIFEQFAPNQQGAS